jgi:hypothetical protein
VGVVLGSISSTCGIKIGWLKDLWSTWRRCSNLLNRQSHSISKLMGTKWMLVCDGWFWKPTNVVIVIDAPILGRFQPGVADYHGCWTYMTSSNNWIGSWLSSLWTLATFDWITICGVFLWVVESATGSLCTTGYSTFWWCSLTFPLCVASMFCAFTCSFPMGCTSHSICSCAYS